MNKPTSSWHIGIAAEAFAAAQFARFGIDVSVQYGANQPEYDLIATKPHGDISLKISVKGSQDGSWGLTQKYKSGCSYHDAIDKWLDAHSKMTVFCLVQFQGITDSQLPRFYLATPTEIAEVMKSSRNGLGDSILYEYHKWTGRAKAAGCIEKIPDKWLMTRARVEELFSCFGSE